MRDRNKRNLIEKVNVIEATFTGKRFILHLISLTTKLLPRLSKRLAKKKHQVAQKLLHLAISGKDYDFAGGGGTSADATGNVYSITGAIGQAIAGSGASNSPYSLQSGFFTAAAPFVPTAAAVTIGGRVLTADGRGIRNVILTMTDASGSIRTATTTAFGYYRFSNAAAGETYIITARGKRFTFASPTQVVNVYENIDDINFIGIPAQGFFEIKESVDLNTLA